MEITTKFKPQNRADWRAWLGANSTKVKEIWLVIDRKNKNITYLDAVEEALCFGWIDGIAKSINEFERAQRFTPRKPKSHWTELNKSRARRLIKLGLMTQMGRNTLPDLEIKELEIPAEILGEMQKDPEILSNFKKFPPLYQRIRISNLQEFKFESDETQRRLKNFLKNTKANKIYGSSNDGGVLEE